MRAFHRMRRRHWRFAGLCFLVCLSLPVLAIAQTDTSTPPKKPARTSTASAAKTKHSASAHATTSHTSSSTSARKTKTKTSRSTESKTAESGKKGSKATKATKKRGQQVIDPDRARAIQAALIREHYMEGEPSGKWDSATQAAMQRYQADHGWQSKTTPDSRALIKLGLGPRHDRLLNPESAMTMPTAPAARDPKPAAPEDHTPNQ